MSQAVDADVAKSPPAAQHPIIAVTDTCDDGRFIVWHVQTNPDYGRLTGAWVFDSADAEGVDSVLQDRVQLPATQASLDELSALIAREAERVQGQVAEQRKKVKNVSPLRLELIDTPDLEQLSAAYHGEPEAATAWSAAMGVSELVENWHTIETARMRRKYLVEAFGAETRSMPLPR